MESRAAHVPTYQQNHSLPSSPEAPEFFVIDVVDGHNVATLLGHDPISSQPEANQNTSTESQTNPRDRANPTYISKPSPDPVSAADTNITSGNNVCDNVMFEVDCATD